MTHYITIMSTPFLIVFGSQTVWPSKEQGSIIRKSVLREQSLVPLIQAVRDLPILWSALNASDTYLKNVHGIEAATTLQKWLDEGTLHMSGCQVEVEHRDTHVRRSPRLLTSGL